MSRLYIKTESDMSKAGARANQRATAAIYWGSAHDSRLAGFVDVYWPKHKSKPLVVFCSGENVMTRKESHVLKPDL